MKISSKLNLLFATILATLAIAGTVTYNASESSVSATQLLDALGRQRMLTQAMAKAAIAGSTGDAALAEASLAEYENAKSIFNKTLKAAKNGGEFPADLRQSRFVTVERIRDPEMQSKIGEIEIAMSSFTDSADQLIVSAAAGARLSEDIARVTRQANGLRKLSNDLVQMENDVVKAHNQSILHAMFGAVVAVFLLLMATGYYLRSQVVARIQQTASTLRDIADGDRDLTRRLEIRTRDELGELGLAFNDFTTKIQGLVQQVQETCRHLLESAQEIQSKTSLAYQSIEAQQSDIDSVNLSIQDMNKSVKAVSESTSKAHEEAQRVDEQAVGGREEVTRTVSTIQEMSTDIENVSAVVDELDRESTQIGSVLDVIRGVSEQTNLLALNAAIEAARAGEQGRGFAVVADEVRTLASRTQESTDDIQQMIENLQGGTRKAVQAMAQNQERIRQGVEEVKLADEALESITASVAGIKTMSTQISSATDEQTDVAKNVSENVKTISESAHDTVSTMNSLTSAADGLARLADEMQILVGQFKVTEVEEARPNQGSRAENVVAEDATDEVLELDIRAS